MVEQDAAPAGVASQATRSGGDGAPPGDTNTTLADFFALSGWIGFTNQMICDS
jgi:hypothetical protein